MATIGVDAALQYQLESAASRPDLAWRLSSESSWRSELTSLVTCADTQCCNGHLAASHAGIPKTGPLVDAGLVTINGTDPLTAEWIRNN